MRMTIGTIGATLAIGAALAESAASSGAQSTRLPPDPAGGPTVYQSDPSARYYVKIDNTGDGYEHVAYRLASVFDGINIDKPGRPIIGGGSTGGGIDDVSGFNV
jgi:hypothetical protein